MMKRIAALSCLVLAGTAFSEPVEAPKPRKEVGKASPPSPASSNRSSGIVAAVDPETGDLRAPTPEERRALSSGRWSNAKGAPPLVVVREDGSRSVYLDERFWSSVVVRKAPDGRFVESCVHTPGAAPEPAAAPPAAPAPARYEER